MARNTNPGPNPDMLPLDKMPVERLAEVLPEGSGLADAVAPPPPPAHTGITSGYRLDVGNEPWLFDSDEFELMADFTPGGSTYVRSVVALNNDLYVFGMSAEPGARATFVARWDPGTNTFTEILSPAGYAAYEATLLGGDVYFLVDNRPYKLEGSNDLVEAFPINSTYVYDIDALNGNLFLLLDASYADLAVYDPAAVIEYFSLPNNLNVYNGLGTAGNYYFVTASDYNIYAFNLTTETFQLAGPGGSWTGREGEIVPTSVTFNGDLYMIGYSSDYDVYTVLKADDATGLVTAINSAYGNDYYSITLETTQTALWIGRGSELTKVDLSGATTTYITNANHISTLQEFGGQLYMGGAVNSNYAMFVFDQNNSQFTLVQDFGGTIDATYPVAVMDGHLIAAADSNGDGSYELWSTANPSNAASWTMISPPDVSLNFNYFNVIEGDYIF